MFSRYYKNFKTHESFFKIHTITSRYIKKISRYLVSWKWRLEKYFENCVLKGILNVYLENRPFKIHIFKTLFKIPFKTLFQDTRYLGEPSWKASWKWASWKWASWKCVTSVLNEFGFAMCPGQEQSSRQSWTSVRPWLYYLEDLAVAVLLLPLSRSGDPWVSVYALATCVAFVCFIAATRS